MYVVPHEPVLYRLPVPQVRVTVLVQPVANVVFVQQLPQEYSYWEAPLYEKPASQPVVPVVW